MTRILISGLMFLVLVSTSCRPDQQNAKSNEKIDIRIFLENLVIEKGVPNSLTFKLINTSGEKISISKPKFKLEVTSNINGETKFFNLENENETGSPVLNSVDLKNKDTISHTIDMGKILWKDEDYKSLSGGGYYMRLIMTAEEEKDKHPNMNSDLVSPVIDVKVITENV